jgi:DNA-binding MarR family transcriptional regulator
MDKNQLIDEFLHLMHSHRKMMLELHAQAGEKFPISFLQMEVLNMLSKSGQSKMTEIKNQLQLSMSAATQLVDRMVKNGWLERVNDLQDRRIIWVKMSKKGQEMGCDSQSNPPNTLRVILEQLDLEDLDKLVVINKKIVKIWEKFTSNS